MLRFGPTTVPPEPIPCSVHWLLETCVALPATNPENTVPASFNRKNTFEARSKWIKQPFKPLKPAFMTNCANAIVLAPAPSLTTARNVWDVPLPEFGARDTTSTKLGSPMSFQVPIDRQPLPAPSVSPAN